MELRVIEKTDTELRIEVAGEDHTFMNVLKGELLETDGVAAATYNMNPEQSGGQTEPVLSTTATRWMPWPTARPRFGRRPTRSKTPSRRQRSYPRIGSPLSAR